MITRTALVVSYDSCLAARTEARSGLGTRAKGGWVLRGVRDMCQSSIHGRSLVGGVWYCVLQCATAWMEKWE